MARVVSLFKGTTGLNDKVDAVRIKPEELSSAVNVDIDRTGRISRRDGFVSALAKGSHSIFPCGNYCLFVSGTDLCVLNPDYSWTAIRTVTQGARMDHYRLGTVIYYLNGYERGQVVDKVNLAWDAASYIGPATTKTFSNPPIGTLLDLYNARMYIVEGDVLWYSEPFAYAWFNLARNFIPMPGRVIMMRAVREGIFVSTDSEQFFFGGKTPDEMTMTKLAEYPAIKGTVVRVSFSRVGEGSPGLGLVWTSEKGICLGSPGGEFKNISQTRIDFAGGMVGAGLHRDGKYIVSF